MWKKWHESKEHLQTAKHRETHDSGGPKLRISRDGEGFVVLWLALPVIINSWRQGGSAERTGWAQEGAGLCAAAFRAG